MLSNMEILSVILISAVYVVMLLAASMIAAEIETDKDKREKR